MFHLGPRLVGSRAWWFI